MQWKHPSTPVAKKFETQPSPGKLMLMMMICDSQGPVLETYLERGITVTSATDCDMLQRGLKPAICSKRRGRLLLHDNAHPHTGAHTLETLRNIQLTVQIWHYLIFTFLYHFKNSRREKISI
jgi:hypothetical protein